jgi:hypothetical protein
MGLFDRAKKAYAQVEQSNAIGHRQGDTWHLLRHPRTPEEVVGLMDRLRETTALRQWSMYRQWYEELLYYFGEHYLEWDRYRRRFQPTRQPRFIPRPITNLILPRVQTAVGQLLGTPPTGRVYPNTRQASDLDGAEAAEKARRYQWHRNNMDQKLQDTAYWTVITGNCWVKSYLERKPKDKVRVELMGEDGTPRTEELYLADLNREVCSPFEMILDWNAPSEEEQFWIVQQKVRNIDWIRETFGWKAAAKVMPEDNLALNSWYQYKMRDLISRAAGRLGTGYSYTMGAGSDLTLESSATVMEWYELPTEAYPDGRIFMVAGGQVLHAEDMNEYKCLPFTHYVYFRLPGSIYGFGLVRNAISPQQRLNGLDAQIDLNRKTMNSGCWLNPKRSGFGSGVANGTPGIIHEYDPARTFGKEPTRVRAESIGADAFTQRTEIKTDMDDLTLTRGGILTGDKPAGVTAGIAFQELRRNAREQHIPIRNNFFRNIEKMEKLGLEITMRSPAWKLERAVKLVGDDGEVKVEALRAADMNGNIDFKIEQSPRRDETKEARRERLMNMATMGLIDLSDPVNRSQFLQEMGFSEYNAEFWLDYINAKRENEAIRKGEKMPIPDPETGEFHMAIGDFDADEIHIRVHKDMTKLSEFESWPEDRQIAMMLEIQEHTIRLEQSIQMEAEAGGDPAEAMASGEGGTPAGQGSAKPGAQPPSPPSSARMPRGVPAEGE